MTDHSFPDDRMNSASTTVDALRSRSWAADELGVEPEASPPQAKAAFLKRLEAAHFLPPESWFHALNLLDPSTLPAEKGAAAVEAEVHAQRLRAGHTAIDQFAAGFWDTAPAERREQWQLLFDRYGEEPSLSSRLQSLEPGLDYSPKYWMFKAGVLTDNVVQRVNTLMELIVEWFPLAPAIRASKRRDWLATIKLNELWGYAAQLLVQYNPGLTALDPEFIAFIRSDSLRLQKVEATVNARKQIVEDLQTSGDSDSAKNGLAFAVLVVVAVCVAFFRPSPPKATTPLVSSQLRQKMFTSDQVLGSDVGVRFPQFFHSNGNAKILDRSSSGIDDNTPGWPTWRLAGGKYRDEIVGPNSKAKKSR